MNSRLRAILLFALLLGIAGVIFFSARSAPKRAATVREPAPAARADEPGTSAPSQAVSPSRVMPPPLPAVVAASAAAANALPENPSAEALAAAMHALEDSAPERALELARRGQALWPAGPRAPEFAATEVKALYRLGRSSEGRGTAEAMVNQYPTSPWALEVERQTGAHPYVNH